MNCDNSHESEFYLPWNPWQNTCSSLLAYADKSLDIITDGEAAVGEGVPFRDGFSSRGLVNTCTNDLLGNLESLLMNADDSNWESGK